MNQDKVLFVDDEVNVISAIRRAVMEESYLSFFAGSGAEALEIIEKHEISVIVTDMRMPVMDGLTLLKIVKEKNPRIVRVVLSGYTQLSQMLVTINQGEIFKFITKPWVTEEDLLPVVRQAVEYYKLQAERDQLRESLTQRNLAYQKMFRGMEQKKVREKEELHDLHKISGWIFSLWRKSIQQASNEPMKQSIELEEVVGVVEEVYLTYLSQLPTVIDVRSSSNLLIDLAKHCDNRLIMSHGIHSELKTKGNHKHLLMMFRILVSNVPEDYKNISCEVVQRNESAETFELIFHMILQSNRLSTSHKNKLKISCELLNKMGKFYSMSVSPQYTGDELNGIRVIWEVNKA